MHEFSIAEEIVNQVLAATRDYEYSRITRVDIELGAMHLIVPEALEAAFNAACENTPAAGARLAMTEVPTLARCRNCHQSYTPTIADYTCPQCLRAEAEILEGRDILLKAIEFDS